MHLSNEVEIYLYIHVCVGLDCHVLLAIEYERMDWIDLTTDMKKRRLVVKAVMKFRYPYKVRETASVV
jgi:hypothetical protein